MERQHRVVGCGVDGNVRRRSTELPVGAVRMLTAKLCPVVVTHRLASRRCQLHVQYVENYLATVINNKFEQSS